MQLCLADLAAMTGRSPRLAAMSSSAGEMVAINHIVLSAEAVREGDLLWRLTARPGELELAFLKGAVGVVSERSIEPWPGRLCLEVQDAIFALQSFLDALGLLEAGESWPSASSQLATAGPKKTSDLSSELKVLQLWSEDRVDIYSSTCDRLAKNAVGYKCRRRAA